MTEPQIILEAEFDPKVKRYWIWGTVLVLTIPLVTIPLAVLYYIIASFFVGRYLDNLSCTLTERTLEIKKGIFNKTESTIPLEKITDLQLVQGPIMRHFGLHGFRVETAGQSSGAGGSLVQIVGIVETKAFRKAVLSQRDRLHDGSPGSGTPTAPIASQGGHSASESMPVFEDISATLKRIEEHLKHGSQG